MVDQIRWINLYGEEVCKAKTHRKDKTKQIETMIPAMIQYGHLNGSKHDTVIQKKIGLFISEIQFVIIDCS